MREQEAALEEAAALRADLAVELAAARRLGAVVASREANLRVRLSLRAAAGVCAA